jgi:hypothetical protein
VIEIEDNKYGMCPFNLEPIQKPDSKGPDYQKYWMKK